MLRCRFGNPLPTSVTETNHLPKHLGAGKDVRVCFAFPMRLSTSGLKVGGTGLINSETLPTIGFEIAITAILAVHRNQHLPSWIPRKERGTKNTCLEKKQRSQQYKGFRRPTKFVSAAFHLLSVRGSKYISMRTAMSLFSFNWHHTNIRWHTPQVPYEQTQHFDQRYLSTGRMTKGNFVYGWPATEHVDSQKNEHSS